MKTYTIPKQKLSKKKIRTGTVTIIKYFCTVMLVVALFASCKPAAIGDIVIETPGEPQVEKPGDSGPMPADFDQSKVVRLSGKFADNPGYSYRGAPAVPAYTVAAGLSNVVNKQQFTTGYDGNDGTGGYWLATKLSDEAFRMIEKNGFAVSDSANWTEFFNLYERNRYGFVPSFITTDSAVHTFFLMFDYILKDLEQQRLYDELVSLSDAMAAQSDAQYKALKGTDFENAARRNVAFFSVGASLLKPDFSVPEYARDLVSQELALIDAHGGIDASPVINSGEAFGSETDQYFADYSQYIVRGHYTVTPELGAYFKAMMWYGQMTFRSAREDEVKSALLQMVAMQDEKCGGSWLKIFEPTNFFVGECDDITWYQYYEALGEVYGQNIGSLKAVTDSASFDKAFKAVGKLEPPQVNSIPVFNSDIQPDREKAISGYRFLGQRFTIDGSIMQRLMDRETPKRMLPKALDIPAAFGSKEAYSIIESEGDVGKYPEYAANMEKVRGYVSGASEDAWHSNLYWTWLDMLRPFADGAAGSGMPFFMQNNAWTRKELDTFISSWTELKYSTVLYAKQPLAEMGAGGDPPEPPDDRGYVEPNPEVYGRLAALIQMTIDGLDQRGLLTAPAGEALEVLKTLADGLRDISEKELSNKALTDEEYEFIRVYGGELEHIWETAKKDELDGRDWLHYLNEHPCAIVVDVAADPNGQVLQEATGFAKEIYVAFPRDGKVVLGRGAAFSQYEFTVPLSQRMTVDDWHEQLLRGDAPPLAEWKKAFIADLDDNSGEFYFPHMWY